MTDPQIIEELAAEQSMFVHTAQAAATGAVPATTGPVTLFIDPFGRPLSPVSVRGVRRREMRRERRRL